MKHFDFCIGNPPYQEEQEGENETYQPPVYDKFMDAAYVVADKVELIHPAKFLFNAGATPKKWNQKMLNDEHFKIIEYCEDATKVFSTTEIKSGVVISYRDVTSFFGAIGVYTKYEELNSILKKVLGQKNYESLQPEVISRTAYRLTKQMHQEYPEALSQLTKGHPYDMSTNIFDLLPQVFLASLPEDDNKYIRVYGRQNGKRVTKYARADYINTPPNLNCYKVYLPSADGKGFFGESLTMPVVALPGTANTETFVGIGCLQSELEAENVIKYIKAKFSRALLGVLKTTHHITPDVWKYVPLQDFTSSSDIDWSKSIPEIDQQLYKKYDLSPEEIDFIESHVKEMK